MKSKFLATLLVCLMPLLFLASCVKLQGGAAELMPSNYAGSHFPGNKQHVALLLPLHGPFGQAGKAVRNGFITAYYNTPESDRPTFSVYDTSECPNILTIYHQALKDGANFIVGPLKKENVVEISKLKKAPIPILALNYDDRIGPLPHNIYQLGLSPKDEAVQVAQRAYSRGLQRTILIYPSGYWGSGIADAFSQVWQNQGGYVVDSLAYKTHDNLKQDIARLLDTDVNIKNNEKNDQSSQTSSTQNEKVDQPQQATNTQMELQKTQTLPPEKPKRRQDFDMIFLVATPAQARRIVPLLKFYYADNIPIYATSLLYDGRPNPNRDGDLDGVAFVDMPWIIEPENKLRESIAEVWPHSLDRSARLYALGIDAYAMVLRGVPVSLNGNIGMLYLKNQRFHRQLEWAKFYKGTPRLI